MARRFALRNSFAAMAQILVVNAAMFLSYKIVLGQLGPVKLGIWSLVMATTSISRGICDMGFANSAIKIVAEAAARGDQAKIAKVVATSAVFVALTFVALFALATPFYLKWLDSLVPPDKLVDAKRLFFLSGLSGWITVTAGVFVSSLDGYHRADLRCVALATSSVIFLPCVFVLSQSHGLIGIGVAQCIQAICILIGCACFVKLVVPMPISAYRFNWPVLRETFGYGMKFQYMTLTTLFIEPITKTLITRFGGVDSTGYYEMASRMMVAVRSVVVASTRVMIPELVYATVNTPKNVIAKYRDIYNSVFALTIVVYSTAFAVLPLVEMWWVGLGSPFRSMISMLLVGHVVYTLAVPAYVMNMATGRLGWNMVAHTCTGVAAAVGGYFGGSFLGINGVLTASAASIAIAGVIVIYGHFVQEVAMPSDLLPVNSLTSISIFVTWSSACHALLLHCYKMQWTILAAFLGVLTLILVSTCIRAKCLVFSQVQILSVRIADSISARHA